MNEPIHSEVYHGYTINIYSDESPESPRTNWDNLGHMCCFHNRYTLGDPQTKYKSSDQSSWIELAERLEADGAVVIKPLYLYDHSGITISTGEFSCKWDSGQIGFIYATKDDLLKEFGGKRITKAMLDKANMILDGEVKTYDMYLCGEIYGYTLVDPGGADSDSCWGYYGDYDAEGGALSEARSIVDSIEAAKVKAEFAKDMAKSGMEE